MSSVFLTAEWRKLIMANYTVDPAALIRLLPPGTELDYYEGSTYVSLVGFMFQKVKVKGIAIPFHTHFPEVNLRFYVRRKEANKWKRGVVFISEIVPKPAITFVANTVFKEHYKTLSMRHSTEVVGNDLYVKYGWKYRGKWNELSVKASVGQHLLASGSHEEFITEHFWGYATTGKSQTGEYQVAHPRWTIYPVESYLVNCDFSGLYGESFSNLTGLTPDTVFLAEGSDIKIYSKSNLL